MKTQLCFHWSLEKNLHHSQRGNAARLTHPQWSRIMKDAQGVGVWKQGAVGYPVVSTIGEVSDGRFWSIAPWKNCSKANAYSGALLEKTSLATTNSMQEGAILPRGLPIR